MPQPHQAGATRQPTHVPPARRATRTIFRTSFSAVRGRWTSKRFTDEDCVCASGARRFTSPSLTSGAMKASESVCAPMSRPTPLQWKPTHDSPTRGTVHVPHHLQAAHARRHASVTAVGPYSTTRGAASAATITQHLQQDRGRAPRTTLHDTQPSPTCSLASSAAAAGEEGAAV